MVREAFRGLGEIVSPGVLNLWIEFLKRSVSCQPLVHTRFLRNPSLVAAAEGSGGGGGCPGGMCGSPLPKPAIQCQPGKRCGPDGGNDGGIRGGDAGGCLCCGTEHSPGPVRYFNGEVRLVVDDMGSGGFGLGWGHRRAYCNRLVGDGIITDYGNGSNWLIASYPYLHLQMEILDQHRFPRDRTGSTRSAAPTCLATGPRLPWPSAPSQEVFKLAFPDGVSSSTVRGKARAFMSTGPRCRE